MDTAVGHTVTSHRQAIDKLASPKIRRSLSGPVDDVRPFNRTIKVHRYWKASLSHTIPASAIYFSFVSLTHQR